MRKKGIAPHVLSPKDQSKVVARSDKRLHQMESRI
jgi:hypothetical protein